MKKFMLSLFMMYASLTCLATTIAQIETNQGVIEVSLNKKKAPQTVANFVNYAKSGFYNGTVFHRIIDGFMIQGGGFTEKMQQKPTQKPIKNEANNGLKNKIGSIAMARTSDPHSASSQFFINTVNNDFLDYKSPTPQGWGYTVFGKVTSGMEVVQRISKAKTGMVKGMTDVPLTPVIIKKITIKQQ